MTKTIKAVVVRKFKQSLVIEEVPVPSPHPSQSGHGAV
jgi:D-arabinose 1-dehydrogenase-like Zn-dependent alcohol dehydrogenase